MTTLREAAQMALEAMEQVQEADTAGATPKMVMEARKLYEPTITALRAALAQPEQEPVAWLYRTNNTWEHVSFVEPPDDAYDEGSLRPVYTAPPQRGWQGLTDEEIRQTDHHMVEGAYHYSFKQGAQWAEAKLKEKNA